MKKQIIIGILSAGAMIQFGHVHADSISSNTSSVEMLKASDLNLQQEIIRLQQKHSTSVSIQNKIVSLKTQDANIVAQLSTIQTQQETKAKAQEKADADAKAKANAQAQADKLKAEADAKAKADAESQKQSSSSSVSSSSTSSSAASNASSDTSSASSTSQSSVASSSSTNGLNMTQTSGTVDVNALGQWLADNKGTFSASKWAQIMQRESGGRVDAQNVSSGAYGVLQILGHGEHRGMTLGEQLQMILPLPASAWAETNY